MSVVRQQTYHNCLGLFVNVFLQSARSGLHATKMARHANVSLEYKAIAAVSSTVYNTPNHHNRDICAAGMTVVRILILTR